MTPRVILGETCPTCNVKAIQESITTLDVGSRTDTLVKLLCGHTVYKKGMDGADYGSCVSKDNRSPYPYQVEGMNFLRKANFNAGIFDEQGLGKTIQALVPIKFHTELRPFLWACKSGLKRQAFSEILRWLGLENMAQIIESPKDFIIPGLRGYIISQDLVANYGVDNLKKLGIQYLIIDECQHIKNPDAKRTRAIKKLAEDVPHRVVLSGTPIKNRPSEYFTVLNLLAPQKFWSLDQFKYQYIDIRPNEYGSYKEYGLRDELSFKKNTADFVIRRERTEVFKELPTINRQFFHVDLEKEFSKSYEKESEKFSEDYEKFMDSGDTKDYANVLARIAKLRHICGLSKLQHCKNFVDELLLTTNKKVCIFTHHKDVANVLKELINDSLRAAGMDEALHISSEISSDQRFEVQRKF